MSTPHQIITEALKSYPSIYRNRLQVLQAVFGTSNYYQDGGEMHPAYSMAVRDEDDLYHEVRDEDELSGSDIIQEMNVRHRLQDEFENVRRKFIVEHAEDLARVRFSMTDSRNQFGTELQELSMMMPVLDSELSPINPDELNTEWRDALLELCWAIYKLCYTDPVLVDLSRKRPGYWTRGVRVATEIITRIEGQHPDVLLCQHEARMKSMIMEILAKSDVEETV